MSTLGQAHGADLLGSDRQLRLERLCAGHARLSEYILRCAQPEWMALAQIAQLQQVLAVREGQRGFFAKPDIPPEGVKRPKRAGDMTYEERAQVGRLPYQDKTTPRTNKRKRGNMAMPPEEHSVLQEPDAFTCRLICCGLHKPGSFRNVFL